MEVFSDYLRALAEKGGPDPSEYDSLNECFHVIAGRVRDGTISAGELLELWRQLGDAFSSVRTLQGHVVAKPYGYAGDFKLMDKIYTQWISPDPMLANWDRFFHSQDAPKAVRRREQYCVSLAQRMMRSETLRVLDLGCGPAREVYDLCQTPESHQVLFDCVDQDLRAIEYARELNRNFSQHARFTCRNVRRFRTSESYDLIWGAGIFDYFNDRAFSKTLIRMLPLLRPDGRFVVVNFSPHNPTRDYMECGQWFVWHRTEDHLRQLAADAGVSSDRITMEEDIARVVNYMHISQH